MDWIKKNYDQFALLIVALVLLGMSGVLIMNAMGFQDTFRALNDKVPRNDKVPPADMAGLERANAEVTKTPNWETHPGSAFVSEPYISLGTPPVLSNPFSKEGPQLHPPVPNQWFVDNKLDILNSNILNEDADGDNFTNLEEFNSQTDPQSKESHPPFAAKLRLVKFIQVPFRLLFNAYDGDPKKPDSLTFQINAKDAGARTQFLKLGEVISGRTPFKIIKFEFKQSTNPSTGTTDDVSELTLEAQTNTPNKQRMVLVLNKEANSPDSYAQFRYLIDNKDYSVKLDASFTLPPDSKKYKLVSVTQTEAVIEDEKGNKITVPHL